jgi:3-hydroxybutyryl-CoA dehydrogenase
MIVGITGLGAMGLGIAQVFAQAGHPVRATDVAPAPRDSARDRMAAALTPRVEKGAMSTDERDAILARLTVCDGPAGLSGAGLVVEAVVEHLDVKRAVLAAIEDAVGPDAVLATNTSSLSVSAVAATLRHPERLVGLHFFNPAPVMRLVELVAHAGSSPAALDRARAVTEAAGKVVVRAPDRPGFIVNRCARPFYGEALAMLEEGRTAADIDAAMLAGGYRMGPFSLIDLVGADVNLAATEAIHAAMDRHPRYHVFGSLAARVADGRLGRKSGSGFVFPGRPGAPPPDAATIVARIEATLANEAAFLLAEGAVSRTDVDTGVRLGLNFPRGPFEILAREGPDAIRDRLAALAAAAPPHLRGRYDPAPAIAADDGTG